MRVVAASGHLDPLHHGHVECFRRAKALGDVLLVIVGNDEQVREKYGTTLMPVHERVERLLRKAPFIDGVIISIDRDTTQCETLRMLKPDVWAKGGDRVPGNMPEAELAVCREIGCEVVYGVAPQLGSTTAMRRRLGRQPVAVR
jgi:D-beta-D-heptose 7-phosphate kinase/D-beta-D-heptose 1-phosphate adenosyltransferase